MFVLRPRVTMTLVVVGEVVVVMLETNAVFDAGGARRDSAKHKTSYEVTGDAVSIPVKPVLSATTSFGIRAAEAGRVEIRTPLNRGAHLAIVAFPRCTTVCARIP
ncbi:unnamed protein product [Lasius platythorax]|uniref:Secreted protein n=1 Tax=Lasius platythorax TaxID=488582 RepID=A0AAV2NV43_9HYME